MSKKASKKATKKNKDKPEIVDDPEPWISELKTLIINDDQWQCNVSLLADTNLFNMTYVLSFNDMFISDKNVRPSIKVISNSSLAINMLENTYSVKVQKDTNLSAYVKLCNEAIKYCSTDGFSMDIPVQILASLIKYHLYELKMKMQAETLLLQEYNIKKDAKEKESLTKLQEMVSQIPTSKKDKGTPKKDKGTPKKEKGTSKKGAPKSGAKTTPSKFTLLRKRGEEFLDYEYIHDEGPHGPQLHVILTSFRHADLALALLKLQIPLIAVTKLHDFTDDNGNKLSKKDHRIVCSALDKVFTHTKIKQRFSNANEESLVKFLSVKQFWSQFLEILSNKDNIFNFKDTIFLKYYPLCELINKQRIKNSKLGYEKHDQTIGYQLQDSIYRQFCFLQYDLQDLKRQHENYLEHLIIQDVKEKNIFNFSDMEYYSSIMDSVPAEAIDIPFILNSILLQVEWSSENSQILRNTSSVLQNKEHMAGKKNGLFSLLKLLDKKHDLFSYEEIVPEKITPTQAVLIHGDEVGLKTYWWDKTNFVKNITCNILTCFWDKIFSRHLPLYDEMFNSCIEDNDSDLFELLKATGDLTIFQKLTNMPCHFNKILVEDKAYVFCTDNSSKDLKNKVSVPSSCNINTRIKNRLTGKFHHYSNPAEGHYMGQIFDNHGYCFEEMTSDILLQNLFNCYQAFNCLDLQQDYFKDNLYLKFHERMTCSDKEYLMGTLRTPVALKDFYDYTLDEEFYWLNEQELLYMGSLSKKERDDLAYGFKQLEHLKKKAYQRIQQMCSENKSVSSDPSMSKKESPPERISIESQASRHDSKDVRKFTVNEYLEAFDIDVPNRVQFSERRQEIVLSTNSKLLIKKLSRLYVDDAVFLQTTIHGHTLYFFRPVNKIIDHHFHLLHESGIVFYLKKLFNDMDTLKDQSKDHIVNIESKDCEFLKGTETVEESKFTELQIENLFKTIKYHLNLSLPNSLCLDVVNPDVIPLYIKQYYLSKITQPSEIREEKFRCNLLDGKLVKFMCDESIIIYYPSGEIYTCRDISYESVSVDNILSDITNSVQKEQTSTAGKSKEKTQPMNRTGKNKNNEIVEDFTQPRKTSKTELKKNVTTYVNYFEHTMSTGRRIIVDGENTIEHEPLFCKSYTDILKGINITERYDGTTLAHNFEGTLFVDFPDGSRITTFSKFSEDEILIDLSENTSQTSEEVEEQEQEINEDMNYEEDGNEEISIKNESNMNDNVNLSHKINLEVNALQSEGFVLIEVHYMIEHPNFAAVSINPGAELLNIHLPFNVLISLNSQGLYTLNFDQKAELIVKNDEIIFQEINELCLPKFTVHLWKAYEEITEEKNATDKGTEKEFHPIFSCINEKQTILMVDSTGDVHLKDNGSITTICMCCEINKNRLFIVKNHFNGLEVFPPDTLNECVREAEKSDKCVIRNYATTDHHLLLLMKPLLKNEYEKWLTEFQMIKYFPTFLPPSTYNDEHTRYNPFPKRNPIHTREIPNNLLVRLINRVNCNIHLEKISFIENKREADLLRINECSNLAFQLYEQGKKEFYKADKTFIENIKEDIIGRILSRVRKRVIKRLEYNKTKEYEQILRDRKLLPYFSSSRGTVFLIMMELIDAAVKGSFTTEEGSHLEKLLNKSLDQLTDDDLDFMHDKIAQFTVGSVCSCTSNSAACKLRILLLAGRTLHGIIPNMISVFFLYADNMKRKKLADEERKNRETNLLQELLQRPLHLLTEDDFLIVHDRLKNLPYCTCTESSEKCKLKILLLASAVLNDFFPNLDSVFKTNTFNVIV